MAGESLAALNITCEQRTYPPYDGFHGTPNAMLWRRVTIHTLKGEAVFEQTDYGHPGQMNAWVTRGVANALLPRLGELQAAAEAAAALL